MKYVNKEFNAILNINSENIKKNYLTLKKMAKDAEIASCVKANAYGLGMIEICSILKKLIIMEILNSMRILITNDDGFNADGIKSLKKIALEMSTEENIFVVAPSANQSAKSRSISYKTEFHITKKMTINILLMEHLPIA